ncbi:MAG: MarR family transcriptional regulator [Spirochaetaceae bacterium]|nr:MarR family transcriptional regulator [Spirochaetaceae bacterium]
MKKPDKYPDSIQLEKLIQAFLEKRHDSMSHACTGSPLTCLNVNELEIMNILAAKGALTMGNLTDSSGLAMSTLTGITNKLVSRNLLKRSRDNDDRRIVRVGLTETGLEAWKLRGAARKTVSHDILSGLTRDEQAEFLRLLEKIVTD